MKRDATKSKLIAGLLGALLFAVVPLLPVGAVQGESITLSPVDVHYELDPGQVKNGDFALINDGTNEYDVKIYANSYTVTTEDYLTDLQSVSSLGTDMQIWVSLSQNKFRIKPGEKVSVPYTLTVPANATPGSHTGVIFAETQQIEKTSGIVTNKRVGLVMYANIKGDYQLKGTADSATIPFLQTTAPLSAKTKFYNKGNAFYVGKVTTKVSDIFGNNKFTEEREYTILPDKPRKINITWQNSDAVGLYKVAVTTQVPDDTHTTEGYVLMLPIWLIAALLMALVGSVAYIVMRKRKEPAYRSNRR